MHDLQIFTVGLATGILSVFLCAFIGILLGKYDGS